MFPGKPICFRLLATVGSPRLARPSGHAAMASLWHQVSLMVVMIGMVMVTSKLAGSPYRKELNKGILMMQESGRMEMLVKKWIGLQGSECAAQQAGLMGWLSSML